MDDLSAIGFDIVGYGCTTCIGNSGPLPDRVARAAQAGQVRPVAILSGNRNFPGRVHPDLELGFLVSPPLVIAYALAGDAERDLDAEPLGVDADGAPVLLRDIWPRDAEIQACLDAGLDAADFARDFQAAQANPDWHALAAPSGTRFPWRPDSTILRRPPFAALDAGSLLGQYTAHPLLVLGDDVTTDHISPASAIPPDSLVADFLAARGEDRRDLNVRLAPGQLGSDAARRLPQPQPGQPVRARGAGAHTLHAPSGQTLPLGGRRATATPGCQ